MQGRRGFLLFEALISLSLLSLGLLACSETFSLAQSAMRRGERDRQLAACAEKQIWENTLRVAVPDLECPPEVTWSVERTALSPRLEKELLVSQTTGDGTAGDVFETISISR